MISGKSTRKRRKLRISGPLLGNPEENEENAEFLIYFGKSRRKWRKRRIYGPLLGNLEKPATCRRSFVWQLMHSLLEVERGEVAMLPVKNVFSLVIVGRTRNLGFRSYCRSSERSPFRNGAAIRSSQLNSSKKHIRHFQNSKTNENHWDSLSP